jgi:hypothetical protein
MKRWPRKGLLLTTFTVVCLASHGIAEAQQTPAYTISTPRPLDQAPVQEPQAPLAPTPQPSTAFIPRLQMPAQWVPANAPNVQSISPSVAPTADGSFLNAPPILSRLSPRTPAIYAPNALRPQPLAPGTLANPGPLEIVPKQLPQTLATPPRGNVTSPQGMVIYNLMFPGAGQDYVVKMNNAEGANSLEVTTAQRGATGGYYNAPTSYPPPGYQPPYPAPAYQPPYVPAYPQSPAQPPRPSNWEAPPIDPTLAVVHRPGPAHQATLSIAPMFTSESDVTGGVDFDATIVPRVALSGHYDVEDSWYLNGRFTYDSYTIVDRQAPTSQHHRDEFDVEALAGYTLPTELARVGIGLGYAVRQVSVAHNQAPSLTSSRAFSPAALYHGPVIASRVGYVIAPAFRADLALEARPFLWAVGDTNVAALTPLFGYSIQPGVSWRALESVVVQVSYRYDFFTGYRNDFIHTSQGPELGVDWRF